MNDLRPSRHCGVKGGTGEWILQERACEAPAPSSGRECPNRRRCGSRARPAPCNGTDGKEPGRIVGPGADAWSEPAFKSVRVQCPPHLFLAQITIAVRVHLPERAPVPGERLLLVQHSVVADGIPSRVETVLPGEPVVSVSRCATAADHLSAALRNSRHRRWERDAPWTVNAPCRSRPCRGHRASSASPSGVRHG
jgi:hypothetical protein